MLTELVDSKTCKEVEIGRYVRDTVLKIDDVVFSNSRRPMVISFLIKVFHVYHGENSFVDEKNDTES